MARVLICCGRWFFLGVHWPTNREGPEGGDALRRERENGSSASSIRAPSITATATSTTNFRLLLLRDCCPRGFCLQYNYLSHFSADSSSKSVLNSIFHRYIHPILIATSLNLGSSHGTITIDVLELWRWVELLREKA